MWCPWLLDGILVCVESGDCGSEGGVGRMLHG